MCYKECRRLLASSMFDRRIDANYLRAMCIASYWLSDISWEVSGCAIRRAAEFNLIRHFKKATEEGNEDSADYVRLWYVLHICDQHLSTLYGRQPIIREDLAIQGWKTFMTKSPPHTASEDTRLASQVALVNIIHTIRDLFGPDTGDPVPQVYSMQIAQFARQLDQWVGHWSGVVTGMLGGPITFTDSTRHHDCSHQWQITTSELELSPGKAFFCTSTSPNYICTPISSGAFAKEILYRHTSWNQLLRLRQQQRLLSTSS